jgi:hypothetical protein
MNSITVIEMREGLSAKMYRDIMGLAFHELVLSDKVKGTAAVCRVSRKLW